jgi:glycosyltransferase involved in cell wall biosynthesis
VAKSIPRNLIFPLVEQGRLSSSNLSSAYAMMRASLMQVSALRNAADGELMTSQESTQALMSAEPKITAIMPAYNCRALLGRSLPPLLQMQRQGEIYEVIVVDDGSTDGTAQTAASLGARVILSEQRHGPAHARNRGACESRGEILWFIDADVVARSDAARQILYALRNNYAAVIGSYDDSPAAGNFCSQYKNLVHHYYHQKIRGDVSSFWAGCGAVWKQRFQDVGGFDAVRYPRSSIEDIEFGYRLQAAGGRIRHAADLQATHLKVWTFWKLFVSEIRDRAIPWTFLLLARDGISDELNISVTERFRAAIAWMLPLAAVTSLMGMTPWWSLAMVLSTALAANLELFALFQRRNGLLFALGGTLFHQFYYLYSSAAYCWCWMIVRIRRFLPKSLSSKVT